MKKITIAVVLLLAALTISISPGLAAGTNPKADVRAAAVALLSAWKAQNAKGLCQASYPARLLTKKSLQKCIKATRVQIKSGQLPAISGYLIRQIEVFRKGHDAFIDVVLTMQSGQKVPLFWHFEKMGGQYLLAKSA